MIAKNPRKITIVILASVAINTIAMSLIIPMLPFYADFLGASPLTIGLLLGLYPLMNLVASPLWGGISDRIGRRPTLLLNMVGTSLSYLCLGFANSIWMLFGARILAGASGATIVIARSYLGDLSESKNRTQNMGYLEAAMALGWVLGLAIASISIGSDPENPHFRLACLIAFGVSLLTLSLGFVALPRRKTSSSQTILKATPTLGSFFTRAIAILQRPLLGRLMGLIFLLTFTSMGLQGIFALWCEAQFGWGPRQFSYIIIFYAAVYALIQIGLVGRAARRLGDANLLLLSIISLSVGFLAVSFSTNLPLLLGALILCLCGQAMGNPALVSTVSQLAGAKQQGQTFGLMQSIKALGNFLGTVWAGFLFQTMGPNWPYWCSSGLMFVAAVLSWKQITRSGLSAIAKKRRHQKLIRLFEILDYDNNGTIELRDFEQAVQKLAQLRGWEASSSEYKLMHSSWIAFGVLLLDLADRDGNGQIEMSEWLECWELRLDYDLSQAFLKLIDANEDGKIAIEELRTFYDAYQIDTRDFQETFNTLDRNLDGYISSEELKKNFAEFIYSEEVQVAGNWLFGVSLPMKL